MKQFLNVFSKKQFGVWEVILSTVKIQSFWKFWSMPRLHLVVLEQAFWQWYYFFEYVVLKTYKVSMWNQINGTLCISLQRILTRFFNHLIAYHAFLWFCYKSMFLSPIICSLQKFYPSQKITFRYSLCVFAGPPHVRQIPPVKAIEGQTVLVACPASGYPLETILWKKGKAFRIATR